jgi:predicted nuclease of restriction endonuclease-like (RecB) superfamily
MPRKTDSPSTYPALLASIKERIRSAQTRAAVVVNRELILLYWEIGSEISRRQNAEGWGTKVIEKLAEDLRRSFPRMQGVSIRNLKYMRAFADAWPDLAIVQQLAAQLPWFHNCLLLGKVKEPRERAWYIDQSIQNNWSRHQLAASIKAKLYRRQSKAITNFNRTLPAPQSELAQQLLKDPYVFDFLTLSENAAEKEIEAGLLGNIRKFLLELGVGFAFVGSQYVLKVAGDDYRIDLLFYHLKLRCYFVIDLKGGAFKPEYSGKMNFYLAAVDNQLRHPDDKPSIGLILCRSKKALIVQYALQNTTTAMGVSEFRHLVKVPKEFRANLPSIAQLEAELSGKPTPPKKTAKRK